MFKKISTTVLALTMTASLVLAGCGKSNEPANSGQNGTDDGGLPPYEINMVFYGPPQKDLDEVAAEMSKITKEKINATVKLVRIEPAAWAEQSILMLTGNEQVDLIVTGGGDYSRQVAQGQLVALDELVQKHGQGIVKAFEPEVLGASKVNGQTYAIPTNRDFASHPIILMRQDLLDKYKLDISNIKTIDDLDAIYKVIHENEPNVNVLGKASAAASIANRLLETRWDILGDYIGVLPNLDELKVVNLYETPEYADMLNTIRRWYQAGYIHKDAATSKETAVDYIKANIGFSVINKGKPGAVGQTENRVDTKLASVDIGSQITSTTSITSIMLGIPTNSKDPDRAMMFLDLLYSDPDLVNLINWGIEGKHYVKVGDSSIDFPPGVDASNSGFNLRQGWMFGNQLLSYTWATDVPNLWEEMDKYNREAKKSAALGFTYNPIPVKTELAAITNVTRQYAMGLETGTIDPEVNLPKFIAALKAAGIDKVIAEKQKQLDEWAKNK
ncbi:extracellular solute-binding protein [Paenibacillus sp. 1011MAR3C5]|uniref:ABC transporter substrate-binding protein n=1 Tax=Paenibacillus sp. 1011MAR3C5 TaxID=1675787 RepID=UPI000E6C5BC6|nr:ABC transporter substrate-binding protein [Paenibacillus sp. 1011MAR3C5]RJE86223.1 extracellular solute-binding protein [Paenibacillus sp. 1011MAR3C5]